MSNVQPASKPLNNLNMNDAPDHQVKISDRHSVDPSAPSRKMRENDKQQSLTKKQETQLKNYIQKLQKRGLPPTKQMILNFAQEMAHEHIPMSWVDNFISKKHIDLDSPWKLDMNESCQNAVGSPQDRRYFELLSSKITEFKIDSRSIYTMDEIGIVIRPTNREVVGFSQRMHSQSAFRAQLEGEGKEWITCLACICADGTSLGTGLICQEASENVKNVKFRDIDASLLHQNFLATRSGWADEVMGLGWMQIQFDPETKYKIDKSNPQHRLLILNGDREYITMEFIEYCDDNNIILAIFPPYSSDYLQPLSFVFNNIATRYFETFCGSLSGKLSDAEWDFFTNLKAVLREAYSSKALRRAFRWAGIAPLSADSIYNGISDDIDSGSEESDIYSVSSISDSDPCENDSKQQVLTDAQEIELKRYVESLCERYVLPIKPIIRNYVERKSHRPVSKAWVNNFIARHHLDITAPQIYGTDDYSSDDIFEDDSSEESNVSGHCDIFNSLSDPCAEVTSGNATKAMATALTKPATNTLAKQSSASNTQHSKISENDWNRIRRYLKEAFEERDKKESNELKNQLYKLQAQSVKLRVEQDRLLQALYEETKKPLLFEAPEQTTITEGTPVKRQPRTHDGKLVKKQ